VGAVVGTTGAGELDTAEVSIAELLKYHAPSPHQTACVGKWHLHTNQPFKRLYPNQMGYDFYSGNFNGAITNYFNYPIIVNGQTDTAIVYATTQTVNDAISWLDTINPSKPFFLWVAFNAPHSPYHKPPDSLCNTSGLTGTAAHINANQKLYFKASLQALDTEIGRLFQYLNSRSLLDSTNIIFIGDNGNPKEVSQQTNITKSKGTLYDYGVRVPLLIAGPAVVSPNRTYDGLVNLPDLFATMAELGGFANWKNSIPSGTSIDSRSLMPVIKNQTTVGRAWIFSEQFSTPPKVADAKGIRNTDYHLIRFTNGNEELYNQTTDIEEQVNLLATSMTSTDISNYHQLCDSLNTLLGVGTCQPLQVSDHQLEQLHFYPNPAYDQLTVVTNDRHTIVRIMDASARICIQSTPGVISISGLPAGIYQLELTTSDGKQTFATFVKQ
jgi:arylsulfatase A-like enzyme